MQGEMRKMDMASDRQMFEEQRSEEQKLQGLLKDMQPLMKYAKPPLTMVFNRESPNVDCREQQIQQ